MLADSCGTMPLLPQLLEYSSPLAFSSLLPKQPQKNFFKRILNPTETTSSRQKEMNELLIRGWKLSRRTMPVTIKRLQLFSLLCIKKNQKLEFCCYSATAT